MGAYPGACLGVAFQEACQVVRQLEILVVLWEDRPIQEADHHPVRVVVLRQAVQAHVARCGWEAST